MEQNPRVNRAGSVLVGIRARETSNGKAEMAIKLGVDISLKIAGSHRAPGSFKSESMN